MSKGRKRRSGMRDAPARNGASARTSPTKRPKRIALPPWRSKNPSTCSQALLGDPHPRAVLDQEVAAEPAAEQKLATVAGHRAAQTIAISMKSVDLALAGDDAAEDHERLAGRDEPDERAGLEERHHADEDVRPWPSALADVVDDLLEVGQLDDAGAVDDAAR